MTDGSPSRLVLVGMRRSGKSTVGRLLGEALGLASVDTDEEIEVHTGRTPAALLAEDGEPRFREIERACVLAVLGSRSSAVIATGGGAPTDPITASALSSWGTVVYLRCGLTALLERLARDPDAATRPVLAGATPKEDTALLLRARDPLYRRLADHVVPADGPPRQVRDAVLRHLGDPVPPPEARSPPDP